MSEASDELRQFLYFHIQNIDRLRILLLMYKERVNWSVEGLSGRLYIPPEKVIGELKKLAEKGFITGLPPDSYRYNTDMLDHPRVEELARMDQEKPVTLINLIYQKPPDPLKTFADAFKIKKKDS